jgi:hypothetical protein
MIVESDFTPPLWHKVVTVSPALEISVISPSGLQKLINEDLKDYVRNALRRIDMPDDEQKVAIEKFLLANASEIEPKYEIGLLWRAFSVEYVASIIDEALKHDFFVEYLPNGRVHTIQLESLDEVNQFINICKQVKHE